MTTNTIETRRPERRLHRPEIRVQPTPEEATRVHALADQIRAELRTIAERKGRYGR